MTERSAHHFIFVDVLAVLHNLQARVHARSPSDQLLASDFCTSWLTLVSRTFALNIRVLPPRLRNAVRLAYLFCRIADTIEDDPSLPVELRRELLYRFESLFHGTPTDVDVLTFCRALPDSWATASQPDQFLVAHADLVFAERNRLDPEARAPIDLRVAEMCRGMASWVMRRGEDGWFRLHTVAELRDYCYYVAGTVGLMLCDLFTWHHGGIRGRRLEKLRERAVAFGLGLQMVNIARDIPADWSRRTSFVPSELAFRHGIDITCLPDPNRREAGVRVLLDLMALAQVELRLAQEYVLLLPGRAPRLRLFCLWPLLMAQDTLALLARQPAEALDPSRRLRIGRRRVRGIVWNTLASVWSDMLILRMFCRRNRRLDLLPQPVTP